jgi:hypothetical protein
MYGIGMMPFNSRSLENLKPENRTQNKQRRNFTLLPVTIAWLAKQPNASVTIDRLVAERGNADSETIQFLTLLNQAWKFVATSQGVKQLEGHPVGLKELHDRCFPYLPWKRFLELVAGIESQAIELVPSREKNYLVGDRSVGAVTFHSQS